MADTSHQVVVAAAVLRTGCLLAARRRTPARLAGAWELPGGKVEPGETDAAALVRECREELGAEIDVIERMEPAVTLESGWVLRGHVVRLAAGSSEPVPGAEHDAIRWLMPEELDDVAWLDADRPLVDALRERLLDGEPLPGGGVGGAVRIGPTVRRPAGPWTPTIAELLDHLRAHGVPCVPRPLGVDARGREVLSYIPGETVAGGDGSVPGWARGDDVIGAVGRWLRRYHEAARSFRPADPRWRLAGGDAEELAPDRVVCHNDIAPANIVVERDVTTGRVELAGVLDWDVAGPGRAIDDLAFAAWNLVPLHAELAAVEAARRLWVLAEAYGGIDPYELLAAVPVRLGTSIDRIQAGAARGDAGMRRLLAAGVVTRVETARARLTERLPQVDRALARES
ncbi:NUDIX domain-containing protein [Actinopolymorpha sp. B11F2]|uniref:NUDIX domain-containing protein n=1 Tax=Actinopolymorpha sp. B11F2 TaxID=3160862 RepID=UPI0032E3BA8D